MLANPSSRISAHFQYLLPIDLPLPTPQPDPADAPVAKACGEFGFGLLATFCPPALVDQIVARYGRGEKRRRLLPARVTVYGLLLMCLYPRLGYQRLMHALAQASRASQGLAIPHKSSFARARRRLGAEPMEALFRALARPLAKEHTAGCWWRGHRVVAVDGTTLELAPAPQLRQFGGPQPGGHPQGPPLARLVTLVECGTRALLDARMGYYSATELDLVKAVRAQIQPGMLVLADRGFLGVDLWRAFTEAGADLLWRANDMVARRRVSRLEDGTYLVKITKDKYKDTRDGRHTIVVRVIEYRLRGSREVYRLVTNLLDPGQAPAPELARLYAERWEIEISFNELKTVQCALGSLRSRDEEGVLQEFWAHCLLYQISRCLAFQAAMATPDRDCDRISFSTVQDTLRHAVGVSARGASALVGRAIQVLTAARQLLSRRDRVCPRIRRNRRSPYKPRSTYIGPRSFEASRRPQVVVCP